MKKMDILCAGILVADVVARPIDEFPERGRLQLVSSMELHSGECAANTGISLQKIGVSTGIIGKIGNDGFGDFLLEQCKKAGLDVRGIVRDDEFNTSATMVAVHSDGERSFIHYLGANANLKESDINHDLLKEAKILHIAGSFLMPQFDGIPTANILRKAKKLGLVTSLDTAWDSKEQWMDLMRPVFGYVDIFLPSIEEAKMLSGKKDMEQITKFFLDLGVKTVGLKMGKQGSFIATNDKKMKIPPFNIKAVDATGAGDAFAAGFLTGILKQWELEQTGRFANAVGAMCALSMGATGGIKDLEETLKFMRETKNEK